MSNQNPYQPTSMPQGSSTQEAKQKLKAPGISLIVVGATGGVLMVMLLGLSVLGAMMQPELSTPPAEMPEAERVGYIVGYYAALIAPVFNILPQILVILGGASMLRQRSLTMARTGAIIAVIPCLSPFCLLGIPFGIWSLLVLADPSVKAGFDKTA